MRVRTDAWLGSMIGWSVFSVEVSESDGSEVTEGLHEHAKGREATLYYVKIDTRKTAMLQYLGRAGFEIVDVNVQLEARIADITAVEMAPGVQVDDVKALPVEIADAAAGIAERCFRFSRFHLDPLIEGRVANRIKREWVLNYVQGRRGENLLIARRDGQPVGFLAVLLAEDAACGRICRIDLIGVDPSAWRQGVARTLIRALVDRYSDRCDCFQVGTQVANIPSIRLYERFGFMMTRTNYVLHRHVRNQAVAGV